MKCENCGKSIKHPYHFDGKTYGIECWKQIALPEIIKRREAKFAAIQKEKYLESYCYIETLKHKDMSKITSNFKNNFISSVIDQFDTKGFLSGKQIELIMQMFNKKDDIRCMLIRYESGILDLADLTRYILQGLYDLKDIPKELHDKVIPLIVDANRICNNSYDYRLKELKIN